MNQAANAFSKFLPIFIGILICIALIWAGNSYKKSSPKITLVLRCIALIVAIIAVIIALVG